MPWIFASNFVVRSVFSISPHSSIHFRPHASLWTRLHYRSSLSARWILFQLVCPSFFLSVLFFFLHSCTVRLFFNASGSSCCVCAQISLHHGSNQFHRPVSAFLTFLSRMSAFIKILRLSTFSFWTFSLCFFSLCFFPLSVAIFSLAFLVLSSFSAANSFLTLALSSILYGRFAFSPFP